MHVVYNYGSSADLFSFHRNFVHCGQLHGWDVYSKDRSYMLYLPPVVNKDIKDVGFAIPSDHEYYREWTRACTVYADPDSIFDGVQTDEFMWENAVKHLIAEAISYGGFARENPSTLGKFYYNIDVD